LTTEGQSALIEALRYSAIEDSSSEALLTKTNLDQTAFTEALQKLQQCDAIVPKDQGNLRAKRTMMKVHLLEKRKGIWSQKYGRKLSCLDNRRPSSNAGRWRLEAL
jgi:hypothetical protein